MGARRKDKEIAGACEEMRCSPSAPLFYRSSKRLEYFLRNPPAHSDWMAFVGQKKQRKKRHGDYVANPIDLD